ncbi:RICIN domain-containing protein [Streptomyces sp. SID3212]|uniref:RICIN domain-containing protein n=1 Tax=Streptomyces sp. SID3212 TaxID=2690259 RepID=UPI001371ED34|nr:RICIN domain-containing protein [Streptomyces sp. SID3212]MYV51643.1 hypothetical protein [Streptomyces sp. SID3212]
MERGRGPRRTHERWEADSALAGYYRFKSIGSGKCLNVAGGVGVGYALIQYDCTPQGAANDVWLPVWEPHTI